MAKFLFIVADSWGPLGCTIPVARELRARGDEVAFAVFDFHGFINRSNPIIPALDAEGILRGEGETVLDSKIAPLAVPGKVPTPKNFALEYGAFKSLFRDFLIPYYEHWCREMKPRIEAFKPDVLWVKDQVLAGAMVGECLRIPWATFSVHTGLIEDQDSLPWTMGLSPPRSFIGRGINAVLKWGMKRFRMTLDAHFNASRARLGLASLSDALRRTAISDELYTIFGAPEIEPARRSWPKSVRFVGPYAWDEPSSYRRPAWLETLRTDVPVVYATIGTLSNRMESDLFDTIVEAFKGSEYTLVMSTGSYQDDMHVQRFRDLPANVHVESFIPNSLIVPRASALIHHGGAGTTMVGMRHGVPAVVLPLNHEHHDFAQRVVERHCGLRLAKNKLTSQKLHQAVQTIITDASYKDSARALSAKLAAYDAVGGCADALRELSARRVTA